MHKREKKRVSFFFFKQILREKSRCKINVEKGSYASMSRCLVEIEVCLSLFFLIACIAEEKGRESNLYNEFPAEAALFLSFMQGKSTSRKKDDTPGLCASEAFYLYLNSRTRGMSKRVSPELSRKHSK